LLDWHVARLEDTVMHTGHRLAAKVLHGVRAPYGVTT